MPARRFPPPCFIVRDASGQALSYVYYESEPGRRSAAKLLTKDEARRIAENIAKLPEIFAKKKGSSSGGQVTANLADVHRGHRTKDEARRIAANIAKLAELLRQRLNVPVLSAFV